MLIISTKTDRGEETDTFNVDYTYMSAHFWNIIPQNMLCEVGFMYSFCRDKVSEYFSHFKPTMDNTAATRPVSLVQMARVQKIKYTEIFQISSKYFSSHTPQNYHQIKTMSWMYSESNYFHRENVLVSVYERIFQ